ncbi:epidermal growth factor receptor kinase substrate 8-like protein 3b [Boleophthalmus pectinirostris]|uniref:epidermal growth factor receptor kinase substrate 8-like protein 3b n=1 Tax=Boleophthalmus pectinirostris TaxID=150288 RepID=UPI00242B35B7|nr:epidermal growth factor receptor kinase substrate 8-like protein 3b [Boleophthalmus pectinirostris]
MFGSSPFSYAPGGLSPEDLSHRRNVNNPKTFGSLHNDDQRVSPVQGNMSRPTGKSIYMQRKEYSETLNKQSDILNVRVEHLFTCEMDGRDVDSISDCVAKLKRLDTKGQLWSQEMILDVQGSYLVLSDIETKSELDSLPLKNIMETNAILDTCAYNSLFTLTVQERNKRIPQVYMFQCEETGAEIIKADIDKAIQKGGQGFVEPRSQRPADPGELRSNLENIIGAHVSGGYRPEGPRAVFNPSPELPQWKSREPENHLPDEAVYQEEVYDSHFHPGPPQLSDTEWNIEVFNHVLNDLEIFMSEVTAAVSTAAPEPNKKKKKSKKKKAEPAVNTVNLPPQDEYMSFLQKIKYAFNIVAQLEEALTEPTAEDYVHVLFNIFNSVRLMQYFRNTPLNIHNKTIFMFILFNNIFLSLQVGPHYHRDIPLTVQAPLLTDAVMQLLSSVVTPEERQLWVSLGDFWTIPSSQWAEEDVPEYIPEFYDNWQPPPRPQKTHPVSRSNSQRFPPRQQNGWGTPPPARSSEPEYMRAIYDFMARNNRELSLMKGDVVEVVQKNKQWWLVRNNRYEEGHVPQNVLESMDQPQMGQREGPVTLDMSSSSAEVSAWLAYKGFSKLTVRSLGVLNGRQLLGMTKDEIRSVCPEDGGKVFFQLQAIKSAIALASEPSGPYNSHY